jgi:hypothetical protein
VQAVAVGARRARERGRAPARSATPATLSLAISAPEGQVNLRAECGVTDALGARSSGVTSVFVDTVAPTCTLVAPTPGTSITPGLDANSDPDDGIQLALRGNASGNDGAGEAATFTITAPGGMTTTAIGTDLSSTGDSTADATFDPATSPATYGVRFATPITPTTSARPPRATAWCWPAARSP